MYEDFFAHFGLQRNPFQVSPDSTHFYSTEANDEALLQLVSRIEVRQGFLVLTGEAGTGKSTVLQYLLDWLKKYRYSSAYIFHPHVTFCDLLQMILEEFGVPFPTTSKKDLLAALKNWLIDRHGAGDSPVILIDEAQSLKSRTLNQLRLLVDLEVQGTKLVQIVLAGQPRLEEKLQQRRLSRLQDRVKWRCRLPALTPEETYRYISTRLAAAGAADAALFPTEALRQVYRYSKGIPRVVNMLCEHACLAAYGDGRNAVTGDDVWRVACQFELAGTAEWNTEALQAETFCRLRRPKEMDRGHRAVVESVPPESQEQFIIPVAHDHAIAVDAAPVNVSETVLTIAETAPEVQQQLQLEAEAPVIQVKESVLQEMAQDLPAPIAIEPVAELPDPICLDQTVAESTCESVPECSIAMNAGARPTETVEDVATFFECASESVVARNIDPPPASSNATAENLVGPSGASASPAVFEPAPESVAEANHKSVREVRPIPKRADRLAQLVASLPTWRNLAKAVPMLPLRRFGTQFLQYWRGVVRSFTRDLREFLDECAGWLQGPMHVEQDAAVLRRVALLVSTWLKQPVGTGPVRRGPSRIPSTAHKHLQSMNR